MIIFIAFSVFPHFQICFGMAREIDSARRSVCRMNDSQQIYTLAQSVCVD